MILKKIIIKRYDRPSPSPNFQSVRPSVPEPAENRPDTYAASSARGSADSVHFYFTPIAVLYFIRVSCVSHLEWCIIHRPLYTPSRTDLSLTGILFTYFSLASLLPRALPPLYHPLPVPSRRPHPPHRQHSLSSCEVYSVTTDGK